MQIASFYLLFISRLFTGLCAGNVAVAQASLVDISDENTKAKNLSLSQMAMGSAYVIGPVIGAILADSNLVNWFGPSVPFWFFAGILAIEFTLLIIFYQDTRLKHLKVTINFLEGFQQIYNALTDKKLSNAFCVWFLFVSGWWLFESFMPAFLYEKFNFNTTNIGYLLGFNGALYATFQYLVIQRIAHKISPVKMVIYSAPVTGLAIISMAYAASSFQLYSAMIVFVLAMGFCIPGLITSISNMAKKEDQGQVMGMIGSVQAMATVIVMSLGGYIHSLNINITIIAGGVLIILSSIIFTVKCLNNIPNRKSILMQVQENK
jgi:MFS family permease